MKPTFHHRLINGLFEDPCIYVRLLRERRALLFDAGDISRLSTGDLMKITDVFITHMHIDHFIGFDTLMRALLRRETPVRFYGPDAIIECIEGKLRGYTWNVIEQYPLRIEAYGISDTGIRHSSFSACDRFQRIDRGKGDFAGIVMREALFTVRAVLLGHGIPCLGFSLEEEYHINIDKAALHSLNLPVGPWLTDFKGMIRRKAGGDSKVPIDGREFTLSELLPVAGITRGQKVSYIVDVSPEPDNITRTIDLVRDSDMLYCEAYFLDKDREKAGERNHLTAKIAGEIARKASVKNLTVLHCSPRYRDHPEVIEREALQEFRGPG